MDVQWTYQQGHCLTRPYRPSIGLHKSHADQTFAGDWEQETPRGKVKKWQIMENRFKIEEC